MSESWEDIVDKPLPRAALEVPTPPWLLELGPAMPETEIQALMETAPNEVPAVSKEQLRSTVDRIEYIVEHVLSDEERAVIEVTVYAGHSIRKAATILGWPKLTVHRLKESAVKIIDRELRNEV